MSFNGTLEGTIHSLLSNISLDEILQTSTRSLDLSSTISSPDANSSFASLNTGRRSFFGYRRNNSSFRPQDAVGSSSAAGTSNVSGLILAAVDADPTAAPPEGEWTREAVKYDIDLNHLDRVIIVIAVAGFLLLVLVVLVCVLNANCPLHAYCPVDYGNGTCRKAKKSSAGPVYGSMDDPIFEKAVANGKGHGKVQGRAGQIQSSDPSTRVHSSARSALHNKTLRDSSEPSDWSDVSLPEMIELKHESQTKTRKSTRTSDYSSSASSIPSPVQPESRLAYGLTFDRLHGRLYVRVIQLGNFRVTDPDGALSPYVKVRVYRTPRHFFTFKLKAAKELPLNQLEAEMQTRIQRRTDNPVFNEYFEMIVEDPDVTAYTVKFLVCDYDKFSRHVVVGDVTVELSKVDLSSGDEILANDLIEPHHEDNLGELHVALMYLPTAEKLSVSVLNAKGLGTVETPNKKHSDAIVKLVLMYDGRPLKKTKTTPKANDSNPVFNETFVFDVPPYQLDKVYFHLAVIGIEKDREDGRHLLGRVYIGVNFEPDAKAQWLEMVHNARKQVACWYKLQN